MSQPRDPERLTQRDLFRAPTTLPHWEQLPPDVRHRAVTLLAQMLRPPHRAPVAVDHGWEVGDE